jgi:hypothetical protein
MKALVILPFLLFPLVQIFAQAGDTAKNVDNIDTLAKHRALFVMDGVVLQKPYHLNPDSIIDVTIITRDKAQEWFHGEPQNDLVILISRRRAIADYQKKFSALSKAYKQYLDSYQIRFGNVDTAYKKYLDAHEGSETHLLYVLDGKLLESGERETIQKLYKIDSDSIKKVKFIKNIIRKDAYGNERPVLIIITKSKSSSN